jgi:glyoxylase-like metal-dependent hydrolase (beta-lactamase superfamily II)
MSKGEASNGGDETKASAYTGHVEPRGEPSSRDRADITIAKLSVGPMDNNTYLLVCKHTNEAVLIDAANDGSRIINLIDGLGGPPLRGIVTTHQHFDHWQALGEVAGKTSAKLYAGADDVTGIPVPTDVPLQDSDKVPLGDCELQVIGLRGHTPGSVALLYSDPNGHGHLFTGDSLFPGGPGKTLSPETFSSLMDDLDERVFGVLPDDTWVYPGHGDDTTLGRERPHLGEWRERGW